MHPQRHARASTSPTRSKNLKEHWDTGAHVDPRKLHTNVLKLRASHTSQWAFLAKLLQHFRRWYCVGPSSQLSCFCIRCSSWPQQSAHFGHDISWSSPTCDHLRARLAHWRRTNSHTSAPSIRRIHRQHEHAWQHEWCILVRCMELFPPASLWGCTGTCLLIRSTKLWTNRMTWRGWGRHVHPSSSQWKCKGHLSGESFALRRPSTKDSHRQGIGHPRLASDIYHASPPQWIRILSPLWYLNELLTISDLM